MASHKPRIKLRGVYFQGVKLGESLLLQYGKALTIWDLLCSQTAFPTESFGQTLATQSN